MRVEKKNENEFHIVANNAEVNMLINGLMYYRFDCSDRIEENNKENGRTKRLIGEAEEIEDYLRKVVFDD